jgi:hypothetical protein
MPYIGGISAGGTQGDFTLVFRPVVVVVGGFQEKGLRSLKTGAIQQLGLNKLYLGSR